jgi:hypothetical protein
MMMIRLYDITFQNTVIFITIILTARWNALQAIPIEQCNKKKSTQARVPQLIQRAYIYLWITESMDYKLRLIKTSIQQSSKVWYVNFYYI